jgi:hypothetical protein
MDTDYNCCQKPTNCPPSCIPECDGSCKCSPIVLDTTGAGFHLTSINDGVPFRLLHGGPKLQMSWTEAASSNGWLVLDRNGNGTIDDFTEMFGNLTPQPHSSTPNGFLALAVFDRPDYGGNGNGKIEPEDAIFDSLRIWIDANHNGISEPSELHTLPEAGIFEIGLQYHRDSYMDPYGNVFRFKGRLIEAAGDNVCYDIMLQIDTRGAQ